MKLLLGNNKDRDHLNHERSEVNYLVWSQYWQKMKTSVMASKSNWQMLTSCILSMEYLVHEIYLIAFLWHKAVAEEKVWTLLFNTVNLWPLLHELNELNFTFFSSKLDFEGLLMHYGKGPKIKKRESMVFYHTPPLSPFFLNRFYYDLNISIWILSKKKFKILALRLTACPLTTGAKSMD